MVAGKVQVGQTSKFSVLDAKGSKVKHVVIPAPSPAGGGATVADGGGWFK